MSSQLRLAYYGDDFTGSTDVMEALARAGLRTVLFLRPPAPEQLAKFPGLRAFGLAGGSRTMSPEAMERELPPAFAALGDSGAPIIHYKICSTFDSSPRTGSIGRAIELGRRVFGERPTPLVVGAPVLGRYVVFGNLFARSGLDTEPFRLDRHPTMSRHPVTPMSEADLRLVLAGQTRLPVELVDVLDLEEGGGRWPARPGQSRAPILLFDTLSQAHLPVIGREIQRMAEAGPLFVAGSSGVEYALVEHWRERELWRAAEEPDFKAAPAGYPAVPPAAVSRIIAVSGSCSPVTDRQIGVAAEAGFAERRLEFERLLNPAARDAELRDASEWAGARLEAGRSVVAYTCRAPEDVRSSPARSPVETGRLASSALAELLERVMDREGIRRAVVCGGDTSMHVARALGIEALEFLGPIAPGSPLCKVHAPGRVADGSEIVFKGGQTGRDRFFLNVLEGGSTEEGPGRGPELRRGRPPRTTLNQEARITNLLE